LKRLDVGFGGVGVGPGDARGVERGIVAGVEVLGKGWGLGRRGDVVDLTDGWNVGVSATDIVGDQGVPCG